MIIHAIDKSGNLLEYNTILTYHSDEFNKDYIVYSDNTYNSSNELNMYISEYDKRNPEFVVKDIPENELNKIKEEIDKVLLAIKNEDYRLENIDDN